MGSFTKISVVVAIVFFVDMASSDPFQEVARKGVNVAADMANTAIDLAKSANSAMKNVPFFGDFPGSQQMTNMANGATEMAKDSVNGFMGMASKTIDMVPTSK